MSLRINWRFKAVLPVLVVLVNGLLVFLLVTISLEHPARHQVRVVAIAGAVIIFAVIVGVMTILLQHPLRELQEKIARVREGDLNVSLSFANRNDDIGDLARDFNEMVRQLRESREEIQRLYRTQMSRAEHLATLGELATGLAHEIRNPLAGIAGVMDIIGRDLPETSPAREVLSEVRQQILQIKRILSDLLETARPKVPDFRPADLNATAERAVALARQQITSQPIEIKFTKHHDLPLVEHDAGQIQQVLVNLLLNAIQAINDAGNIRVRVGSEDGFATISISDTGRGIPPEHLANIFRPFFTTKKKGTGLGLSLVSRIGEGHGGRVEVSSTPGEGSQFTVWLPFHHVREEQKLAACAGGVS
jgi:signal transduction histidine kinase